MTDLPFEAEFDLFVKSVKPRLREMLDKYQIPAEDREDMLDQVLLVTFYQWEGRRDARQQERRLQGILRRSCKMYWHTKRHSG